MKNELRDWAAGLAARRHDCVDELAGRLGWTTQEVAEWMRGERELETTAEVSRVYCYLRGKNASPVRQTKRRRRRRREQQSEMFRE